MARIGYARVSTCSQNLEVQLRALESFGCTVVFQEKKSGKDADREELNRLGRSLRDILNLIERFQKDGNSFVSLTDNIDLSTPGGKFQLHVFAAFAELERNLIAERCTAGRMEAKSRGVKFGPKNKAAIIAKAKEVRRLYDLGLKVKEIQKMTGIKSNKTVYNYLKIA